MRRDGSAKPLSGKANDIIVPAASLARNMLDGIHIVDFGCTGSASAGSRYPISQFNDTAGRKTV
ncbi:hypothetical protein GCM10023165_23000 [Variovorax defluvii]|uniref:Uncharacterized protein n=1 Tax=Variovorax defluvii TaxID=913761 RepID=A0ABP8HNM1_9BURK